MAVDGDHPTAVASQKGKKEKAMRLFKYNFVALVSMLALLVVSTVGAQQVSQTLNERIGDRERYAANGSGVVLAVVSPVDNEAVLVHRVDDTETRVIGFGDTVPGIPNIPDAADPNNIGTAYGPVTGIGHASINDNGVIVTKVSLTSENVEGNYEDGAILVGTPGNMTTIAHTLQELDGQVICNLEPMPQINNAGQVFFGATIYGPRFESGGTTPISNDWCDEDGGEWEQLGRASKSIFRWTPGVGVEVMLSAAIHRPDAQTVTTANPAWVDSETTFAIIDAELIAHSHNTVLDNGHVYVYAYFSDDPTSTDDSDREVNRRGALYLDGSATPQLVALEEDVIRNERANRFGYIGKLAASHNGNLVFKTDILESDENVVGNCEDEARLCGDEKTSELLTWQPGASSFGVVVASGDPVPGAPGEAFNGFPPLMSTNDTGAIAFSAGLDIPDVCELTIDRDWPLATVTYERAHASPCRGIYLYSPTGAITEIARTTRAALGGGVGATSHTSIEGDTFYFDSLSAVAVIGRDDNKVYFAAEEALDRSEEATGYASKYSLEHRGPESGSGQNGISGVFVWNNGTIERVLAEGDPVVLDSEGVWETYNPVTQTQGLNKLWQQVAGVFGIDSAHAQGSVATVVRLFIPQPHLRSAEGKEIHSFNVRAWIDVDGDYVGDFDTMVSIGEAQPPVPVPALSEYMFILLGVVMMLLGGVMLRGRH